MVPFILGPREHHGVTSASEYEQAQRNAIARLKASGARFDVHDVATPLVAFVSANNWVVDCECGAGNAVDPTWGVACCFACGAVHRSIVFPGDRVEVEAVLLDRTNPQQRHWVPGESPAQLREENRAMKATEAKGRP